VNRSPVLEGELDVTRTEAYSDRVNFWSRVRREAPVGFAPNFNAWIVSSRDAVTEVVRDTTRFGKQAARPPMVKLIPEAQAIYDQLRQEYVVTLESNPPAHTPYRQKVMPALAAPKMETRRPIIEQLAHDLIDEFEDDGQADLMDRFAFPLPAIHGFDLIGVPAADLQYVRRISLASIAIQFMLPAPEEQVQLAADTVAYWRYLNELVDDHRKGRSNDLINDLVETIGAERAAETSTPEIASMLWGIVRGAHHTTTHLIGNALHCLLTRPELWQRIVADPTLARAAIDESLRRNTPAPGHFYMALTDTELEGVQIPAGDIVYPVYDSVNQEISSNPEEFDIDRPNNRQNFAFGAGPHLCPAKTLGRVSGAAAVELYVRRLPHTRLGDPTPHWVPVFTQQGLSRLEVEWVRPVR
jgi:cytochrome P450